MSDYLPLYGGRVTPPPRREGRGAFSTTPSLRAVVLEPAELYAGPPVDNPVVGVRVGPEPPKPLLRALRKGSPRQDSGRDVCHRRMEQPHWTAR